MPPKRSLRTTRQTKLDFSPKPKPTRNIEISSDESPARPTKKRRLDLAQETLRGMKVGLQVKKNPLGMFGSSDNEVSSVDSDSSESTEESKEPQPKKSRPLSQQEPIRAPRKERNKVFVVPQDVSSEESDELVVPKKSRKPAAKKALPVRLPVKPKLRQQSPEEKEESDESVAPRSSRKALIKKQRPQTSSMELDDQDSEDEIAPRSSKTQLPVRSPAKRKGKQLPGEPKLDTEEEEEEDEIAPRSSRKSATRKPTSRTPAKRRHRSPTPDEEEEDSEEEDIPRSTQRRQAPKRLILDPEEQAELADDLEFLQSSPPASKDGLRSRHSKPLTQREKALEALKRRRASSGGEPSSSATPGRKRAIILSDSDDELEVIKEEDSDDLAELDSELDNAVDDEEVSEEDDGHDEQAPSGTNALDMFHEDVNDEGFIDDDGPIGVPADLAAIPIQFSSISRAKPKELFKYAIEWMVHKKINPAFPRSDEIYELAFRKLDDEVKGLANSKYSSAAWTPDFTRALRARPDILLNEIGSHMKAVMSPHCEACNRKTHPASWEISLTGTPYNKDTLEPLNEDSDSSSSSDSDSDSSLSSAGSETNLNGEKPTYDATGEQLPPESKAFTLGSTCKANAQMAHTLHHWRYHLNSWVVDYLVREGHCSPEKVVERDSWREKKREKYANKIVDKMEKEGEVRTLHKLYKNQVDYAFEAKNEYRQGWGRRG
jgi:hypothetical protein